MSVPNVFAAVTAATGAQLDANFAAVLNLTGGGTVAGTGSGAGLVVLSDTGNASGVSLKLVGNGSTTPSKTVQAKGGLLTVLNDAQTAVILGLSDAGVLSLSGAASATAEVIRWDQVHNIPLAGVAANNGSVTSLAVTTASFTAPSNGSLAILALATTNVAPNGFGITASLAGLVTFSDASAGTNIAIGSAQLPMTAGQSSTVTLTVTTPSLTAIGVYLMIFFMPTP